MKANPFGLSDILGNVKEYVQDSWDPAFYLQFTNRVAVNPSCSFHAGDRRVIRDGCWNEVPSFCRSSNRYASIAIGSDPFLGFRPVLMVDSAKKLRQGN